MLIKLIKNHLKQFELVKLLYRLFSSRKEKQEKLQDFNTIQYKSIQFNAKECCCAKKKSKRHGDFFVQRFYFFNIFNRLNLFEYYCRGKKVLHIGCVDYPIFNPENNLHIALSKFTSELHGLDLNIEGLKTLKQYVDQPYFSSMADLTDSYDVCLIPEVIEHIDNISLFLKEVEKIKAELFIITAPNAFGKFYRNLNFFESGQISVEIEHQDHNCYFSPYTLKNLIQKYSCLEVRNIFLTNNQKAVSCVCGMRACSSAIEMKFQQKSQSHNLAAQKGG